MTGPTPLRRDAAANRARLVAAAVDVFNDQGIDAGVEAIARRAGVGVGTLYRRFPTKDALIDHLVAQVMADMTAAAVEARDVADGRGLEQFVRTVADQLAAHRGCLVRLWRHSSREQPAIDRLREHIDELVALARAAGAVRPDVDRAGVTTVMWALQGIIENAGDAGQQVCADFLTTVFAGLAPPG